MRAGVGTVITGLGLELPATVEPHHLLLPGNGRSADDKDELRQKLGRRGTLYKDHATRLALLVARYALVDAGLPVTAAEQLDGARFGIVAASNFGNLETILSTVGEIHAGSVDSTSPMSLPNLSSNVIASTLAIWYGMKALNLFLCSGSTSGTDAIWLASNAIEAGRAARMLVVGVEVANEGLDRLLKESGEDSRPLSIGAAVVLEGLPAARQRQARAYAQVGAYASGPTAVEAAGLPPPEQRSAVGLWLTPGDHAGGRQAGDRTVLQEPFGDAPSEREALMGPAGDGFAAHGVLQAIAAAHWLGGHPGRRVLATSGGSLGSGLASIVYQPVAESSAN